MRLKGNHDGAFKGSQGYLFYSVFILLCFQGLLQYHGLLLSWRPRDVIQDPDGGALVHGSLSERKLQSFSCCKQVEDPHDRDLENQLRECWHASGGRPLDPFVEESTPL